MWHQLIRMWRKKLILIAISDSTLCAFSILLQQMGRSLHEMLCIADQDTNCKDLTTLHNVPWCLGVSCSFSWHDVVTCAINDNEWSTLPIVSQKGFDWGEGLLDQVVVRWVGWQKMSLHSMRRYKWEEHDPKRTMNICVSSSTSWWISSVWWIWQLSSTRGLLIGPLVDHISQVSCCAVFGTIQKNHMLFFEYFKIGCSCMYLDLFISEKYEVGLCWLPFLVLLYSAHHHFTNTLNLAWRKIWQILRIFLQV